MSVSLNREQWLRSLPPEFRRFVLTPPHPSVVGTAVENLDFERGMISLAACGQHSLESVTVAFKAWAVTRPEPWRDLAGYCKTHFLERGEFPFEVLQ